MRKKNIIVICSILLVIIMLCGGCAAIVQNFENEEVRQRTESMLDAMIEDDFQTAYSMVSEVCTETEFAPIFTQMQELLGNADTYELKLLSIYTNTTTSNGQTIRAISAVYEMILGSDKIIVSVGMDDQTGLTDFYLTPYDKTDYYSTGTIRNMKDATGIQWLILLSNIITIAFTVFALVDCLRHKIKIKALWILLLILGFISVGVTSSTMGVRLNFNVGWIFVYSALIRYGSGTLVLRFMLPVGAIAYFSMRHSLLKAQEPKMAFGEMKSEMLMDETGIEQCNIIYGEREKHES